MSALSPFPSRFTGLDMGLRASLLDWQGNHEIARVNAAASMMAMFHVKHTERDAIARRGARRVEAAPARISQ